MLGLKKKDEKINFISPQRMGELLLTRFTHDIAGPISAVANGLDYVMNEAKDASDAGSIEIRNQAIDLIEESSVQSLARLQAYRVAYGVVYSDDSMADLKEVKEIFKRFFHKSQIDLRWNSSTPENIQSYKRRLLIGMILTTARILIYGGKISVSFQGDDNDKITIKSSSVKFKEPQIVKQILMNEGEVEPDVENIPYFFIRETAAKHGTKIKFDYTAEEEHKEVVFVAEFG